MTDTDTAAANGLGPRAWPPPGEEASIQAGDRPAARRSGTAPAAPPANRGLFPTPPPQHRVVGQAGGKYLVLEGPTGLVLVDPHALHERWNYERLMGRASPPGRQALLIPVVVDLSAHEAAMLELALPALRECGFDVEEFGERALSVGAAPSFVPTAKIPEVVKDVLADLDAGERVIERVRERVCATLACRASVLLGTPIAEAEACALLDMLFRAGQTPTCPHGRPTSVEITWSELTRRFGRS